MFYDKIWTYLYENLLLKVKSNENLSLLWPKQKKQFLRNIKKESVFGCDILASDHKHANRLLNVYGKYFQNITYMPPVYFVKIEFKISFNGSFIFKFKNKF